MVTSARARRSLWGGARRAHPEVALWDDGAGLGESLECLVEMIGPAVERGSERRSRERSACTLETSQNSGVELPAVELVDADGLGPAIDDREMRRTRRSVKETQRDLRRCGGGAVLDGEAELIAIAAKIQETVHRRVEISGAAEPLTILGARRAVLASVVYDDESEIVLALESAEISEERGDIAAVILAQAMQPDEGIEEQQARAKPLHSSRQARLIALEVEA